MTATWLNINRNGRLGNRLFSRAHVYAAAIEHGATVVDWGLSDVARHFPRIANPSLPVYPLRADGSPPARPDRLWLSKPAIAAWRAIRPRRTGHVGPFWSSYWGGNDPDLMRLDGAPFAEFVRGREMIILDGYKLRCTPWVVKHADSIRQYFAVSDSIQTKWTKLQDIWHGRWRKTVGVHMRGGDFSTAQGGRYHLSAAEYAGLLGNHPGLPADDTLFVLFSEDRYAGAAAFARLTSAFSGLNHIFLHGDLVDDLAGLASCDLVIGPATSTFSRWASFAGNRPWAGVDRTLLDRKGPALDFRDGLVPWDY